MVMFAICSQRVVADGGGSEIPVPPGLYTANDPAIEYTDCTTPTFVNGWARFQRPIADTGSDYQYCMPGARQRFMSTAPSVTVNLRWNGLVTRADARNLIGHVFIDGVYSSDWQTPFGVNGVGSSSITISPGSSANRLYEIILPYGDGVEFGSVQIDPTYVVTAASPRTGRVMATLGDSISQGFLATDLRRSWPFLLAQAKGFRCINLGYGGRPTVADDGTKAAQVNPDLITVLLGMNDWLGGVPLSTYKAALKLLLQNIHAVNPTVPVYLSGMTLTTQSGGSGGTLSDYQNVAGQCITELGYSQLVGVATASLISSSAMLAPDGVHPNDTGHANMASGWGAVIT